MWDPLILCNIHFSRPACCSSQQPTRPGPSATTRPGARSAVPQLAGPAYHVHVGMLYISASIYYICILYIINNNNSNNNNNVYIYICVCVCFIPTAGIISPLDCTMLKNWLTFSCIFSCICFFANVTFLATPEQKQKKQISQQKTTNLFFYLFWFVLFLNLFDISHTYIYIYMILFIIVYIFTYFIYIYIYLYVYICFLTVWCQSTDLPNARWSKFILTNQGTDPERSALSPSPRFFHLMSWKGWES